ncbi:MAG: epimerase [Candidatus Eisenbacteria sp.]|nr:epimerase [Candidatus Eisenbacteria bacterium]
MRLLILGGTIFLGRHLAEAALQGGHEVTLFHRGRHNPHLFPKATHLHGDRDGDLHALAAGEWDAVVDTSGYLPRLVRDSARLLSGRVGHYTFVSSISVYRDPAARDVDETAPLVALEDQSTEQLTAETYGPLKALCEQAAEGELPGRTLIVRPGLIVGPHDLSDRFTYWPRRVTHGGSILAPGRPGRSVQIIDVRDLAAWLLVMSTTGRTGVYNATGPEKPLTMEEVLETCREASDSVGEFVWVTDEFLLRHGVVPFTEMPLWIPHAEDRIDCRRAIRAGLAFRPLRKTAWETVAWDLSRPPGTELRAGLGADREIALLQAWRGETSPSPEQGPN